MTSVGEDELALDIVEALVDAESHLVRVYRKLGLPSRAQLVAAANSAEASGG